MSEENKVENIEIETLKNNEEIEKNRKRTDFLIEMALLLILGILIGIAVKTEANKRITIGFNDYKMKIPANMYNINKLQTEILDKIKAESGMTKENPVSQENNSGEPETPNTSNESAGGEQQIEKIQE